jgi:aryl-alcohol dehydrogenase-like predicted oxidoreductase/enamine deaminase RidA (YjgF/YER057c/UK114 family)
MRTPPHRIELAPGLDIPRVLTGLWQVADMERGGVKLDLERACAVLGEYTAEGYDAFDMADHYGSAEEIAGHFLANAGRGRARAFTKWCPEPGPMTPEIVREGVGRSFARLALERIDLMQLHWWRYSHPGYIDAMSEMAKMRAEGRIQHLGVTNFDTDHLRLLVKHGIPVVSNQVSFSLLDRRAARRMSEFCRASGVKLLAYGTLAGGFLTDHWVGRVEPQQIPDWSKSKYKRFIDAIGGWGVLQEILSAAKRIADKHRVSVANVAARWVLEHDAVAAVIIGARLGEREHRADNLGLFSFSLDAEDQARLGYALAKALDLPGDCGDEYRKPPFLTATGDLSHHLDEFAGVYEARSITGHARRWVESGSKWEGIAGYSRALRTGNRILVSGTTATHGAGLTICAGDVEGQTVYALDKIGASIEALGGTLADVVRTRIYVRDAALWQPVAHVHERYFGAVRPVNTLVQIGALVGDCEIEIEAEAEIGA